jgi:hypothetical protein
MAKDKGAGLRVLGVIGLAIVTPILCVAAPVAVAVVGGVASVTAAVAGESKSNSDDDDEPPQCVCA